MTYQVRLEQFEGPLELLLNLIEKEKLDITRVSLSRVADQYLEYIKDHEEITLPHLGRFLGIASRLILLKSRALLPLLTFTEEEERSIDELEWQLQEYRRLREASRSIGERLARGERGFARPSFLGAQVVFHFPEGLTPAHLREAFEAVLGDIPLAEKLEEETLASVVTLEERMAVLQTSLTERLTISFRQVTEKVESRVEMIVTFLALLELVKQRIVRVRQTEHFSDIHIERHSHAPLTQAN